MRIFDFDGTLVDLWPRFHAVFTKLTGSSVDLHTFRIAKLEYVQDEAVARQFGVRLPSSYFDNKAIMLEDPSFLRLDQLWLGSAGTLDLFSDNESIILSRRRQSDEFKAQLRGLGLEAISERAFVTQGSKLNWVASRFPNQHLTVVGDSLADLEIGRIPGVQCLMLGCGLTSAGRLLASGISHWFFPTLPDLLRELGSEADGFQNRFN
jgi:phosphoglycolate phosphatase-like HAD superfamily hydrolase